MSNLTLADTVRQQIPVAAALAFAAKHRNNAQGWTADL